MSEKYVTVAVPINYADPKLTAAQSVDWSAIKNATVSSAPSPSPVVEVSEREMAILLLAVRDIDASDTRMDTRWAQSFMDNCENEPHRGDCPLAEFQGPITCDRCVCDEFKLQAAALIAALRVR